MSLRILLVEDEPLIAMDLEDILLDAGNVVVAIATNMHHALEVAETSKIDIAILDIDLALGTNGIETAKRLRERHNVSSLFVSAQLTDETRAMALEWQPLGFVAKPFSADQIVTALRTPNRNLDSF
ncbi:MAG: response regulator [Alphaproteobacteria bacterium]|nr:MAG: response regulator [Alphaproteobacteria bacterium]